MCASVLYPGLNFSKKPAHAASGKLYLFRKVTGFFKAPKGRVADAGQSYELGLADYFAIIQHKWLFLSSQGGQGKTLLTFHVSRKLRAAGRLSSPCQQPQWMTGVVSDQPSSS